MLDLFTKHNDFFDKNTKELSIVKGIKKIDLEKKSYFATK